MNKDRKHKKKMYELKKKLYYGDVEGFASVLNNYMSEALKVIIKEKEGK